VNRLPAVLRSPLANIRIFFFLWFAGGSFLQPYLPIFYRGQGLSGLQIGLLASIGFGVAIVAAPQWGRWNDRLSAPQRLLQLAVLMHVATMLILSRQTAFLPMIAVVALNALFSSAQEPVAASLAMRSVRGTGSGFGSVRVWGSLGWSILVLVSGWLIQRTTIQTAFAGFAVFLLAALSVLFLHRPSPLPQTAPSPPPAAPTAGSGEADRYRPVPALFLAVILGWIAVAGVRQFESLFIKQLGAGEEMIGFSAMLSALVELPGMFWADSLARRFGARRVLVSGMILDGLLRGSVLLWPSIPAIVVSRALVGISFSLTTVGVVAYVQEITPHRHQTRAVALYTVVARNMVFLAANPLGGVIFDTVGALWLYAVALVGNMAGGLILLFGKAHPPQDLGHSKNPMSA
jgi:PPP family 3-phenylpropionic acid transporter